MEKIDFNATDGIKLSGLLYQSKEGIKKIILSVHGMTSNCFKKREDEIAKEANKNQLDYFCFNNRGSEIVRYLSKDVGLYTKKVLGGMTYEDVLDGYKDIVGAILKLKELGYEEIYLQGHSLGCTKIVYTYNRLKDENSELISNIKGVILLSLVDIPTAIKVYLGIKFNYYLQLAEEKAFKGKVDDLMPKDAFIHPICVRTFLRYARDNEAIDFARYGKDKKLKKLNNIDVPLFMRWGNNQEMIIQKADELVKIVDECITNDKKDINFIDGANHGYKEKETILAKQIIQFIKEQN